MLQRPRIINSADLKYVSKSNLSFADFRVDGEEDIYTQAFQKMREDIKPQLEAGVALDMKTLLDLYQEILEGLGCNTAKNYKTEAKMQTAAKLSRGNCLSEDT